MKSARSTLLVLAAFGLLGPLGCATQPGGEAAEAKIIGGSSAGLDQYPWMTAIYFFDSEEGWWQGCGGSLVDPTHIITAAHCSVDDKWLEATKQYEVSTADPAARRIAVRPRSLQAVTPADLVRVKAIYVHPQFDPSGVDNDVAVLELATPVASPVYASIESLSSVEELLASHASVRTIGYGVTEHGGRSDDLKQVDVPLVGLRECRDSYPEEIITENMICAGENKGGKDSCQGDSGGPLFRADGRPGLVGVVSWGEGCALPNKPGVYTKISRLDGWLRSCVAGPCQTMAPVRTCWFLYGDCDGNPVNGCEADLVSRSSCGTACGAPACGEGEACIVDDHTFEPRCSPGHALSPKVECTFVRPDGSKLVSFGWSNENDGYVRVDEGPDNKLSGISAIVSPFAEAMPVYFTPGETRNFPVAIMTPGETSSWTLKDAMGVVRTVSVSDSTPACAEDPTELGRVDTPSDPPSRKASERLSSKKPTDVAWRMGVAHFLHQ